jgi:hypothetical protein
MQQSSITFTAHVLDNFADSGLFMDHLIVINAITNPFEFGFCLRFLGNNTQHGIKGLTRRAIGDPSLFLWVGGDRNRELVVD